MRVSIVACKFGFRPLSATLLSPWSIMDLTVLEGKCLLEEFWLVTKCTPINSMSISIFSPLYGMILGMKIPFESSFLDRPCILFWYVF